MGFRKHDWVKVRSLQRDGEIIELMKSGEFRVAVGGLSILCGEKDLELVPRGKHERQKSAQLARTMKRQKESNIAPVTQTLDLHGMRVEEAIKLVEARIDRALLDNVDSIKVVHGVGSGRIMTALHKYLATVSAVKSFRLDENPGVTWVYF